MILLLARLVLNVLANAVGLIAAAVLLEGFSISGTAFVIAVAIFSITTTVLGPLIIKIALTNAPFLVGGIALVTTLVGLIVTNLVSDGISITGLNTWIIATLVVWIFAIIGNLLLPLIIFRKTFQQRKAKATVN